MKAYLLRFLALTAAALLVIRTDATPLSLLALIAVALVVAVYELDIIRDRYETKEN